MADMLDYELLTYRKNPPHPDPLRAQYTAHRVNDRTPCTGNTWEGRLVAVLDALDGLPRDGWQMTASAGDLREFCHFDPRPFGRRLLIRLCNETDAALDK